MYCAFVGIWKNQVIVFSLLNWYPFPSTDFLEHYHRLLLSFLLKLSLSIQVPIASATNLALPQEDEIFYKCQKYVGSASIL